MSENIWDIFGCHHLGRVATGLQRVEAKDDVKQIIKHKAAHHNQELGGSKVSNANFDEPWSRENATEILMQWFLLFPSSSWLTSNN